MGMKRLLFLLMLVAASSSAVTAQTSWEETLAASRQEGKVVVAGPPSQELRRAMPAAFKARYGITMEYIGGRSTELASRLRAERQAGIHSLDVVFAGNESMATVFYREKMLQPLRPALVLPEVTDGAKWKKGKLWFSDPDDKY